MAPGAEEVSFKRVTQGEGKAKKHYFIMCTLHEDEEDFEKSSLDLAVTSEHNCWQAQGQFSFLHKDDSQQCLTHLVKKTSMISSSPFL